MKFFLILLTLGMLTIPDRVLSQATTGANGGAPLVNSPCPAPIAGKTDKSVHLMDGEGVCIFAAKIRKTDLLEAFDENWILKYSLSNEAIIFNDYYPKTVKDVVSGRMVIKKGEQVNVTLASGSRFFQLTPDADISQASIDSVCGVGNVRGCLPDLRPGGPYFDNVYTKLKAPAGLPPGAVFATGANSAEAKNARAIILHNQRPYLHDAIIAIPAFDFKQCTSCSDLSGTGKGIGGSNCSSSKSCDLTPGSSNFACQVAYQKQCEESVKTNLQACKDAINGGSCKLNGYVLYAGGLTQGLGTRDYMIDFAYATAPFDAACAHADNIGGLIICDGGYTTAFQGLIDACKPCIEAIRLEHPDVAWNRLASPLDKDTTGEKAALDIMDARQKDWQTRSDWLTKYNSGGLTPADCYSQDGSVKMPPAGGDMEKCYPPRAEGCDWNEKYNQTDQTNAWRDNAMVVKYYRTGCNENAGCLKYRDADSGGTNSCMVGGREFTSIVPHLHELSKCMEEGGFSMNKEIRRWADLNHGGESIDGDGVLSPREVAIQPTLQSCGWATGDIASINASVAAAPAADAKHLKKINRPVPSTVCPYKYDANQDINERLRCVDYYLELYLCADEPFRKNMMEEFANKQKDSAWCSRNTCWYDDALLEAINKDPNICTGDLYYNRAMACTSTSQVGDGPTTLNNNPQIDAFLKTVKQKSTDGIACGKEFFRWTRLNSSGGTNLLDNIQKQIFVPNYFAGAAIPPSRPGLFGPSVNNILGDCRYLGAGFRGDGRGTDEKAAGSDPNIKDGLGIFEEYISPRDRPIDEIRTGKSYNDRFVAPHLGGGPFKGNRDFFGYCRFYLSIDDDRRIAETPGPIPDEPNNTPPPTNNGCFRQFGDLYDSTGVGSTWGGMKTHIDAIGRNWYGIFDGVVDQYKCIMNVISAKIIQNVKYTFGLVVAIEMAWFGILGVLTGRDLQSLMGNLAQRIIWIGFLWALILGAETGMFNDNPINTNWIKVIPDSFDAVGKEVIARSGSIVPGGSLIAQVTVESLLFMGILVLDHFLPFTADFIPILNIIIAIVRSFVFMPTIMSVLSAAALMLSTYVVAWVEMYVALGTAAFLLGIAGTRWTFNMLGAGFFGYAFSSGLKILICYVVGYIYIEIIKDLQVTTLAWMAVTHLDPTTILYIIFNLYVTGLLTMLSYVVQNISRFGTAIAGAVGGAMSGGEAIGAGSHIAKSGADHAQTAHEQVGEDHSSVAAAAKMGSSAGDRARGAAGLAALQSAASGAGGSLPVPDVNTASMADPHYGSPNSRTEVRGNLGREEGGEQFSGPLEAQADRSQFGGRMGTSQDTTPRPPSPQDSTSPAREVRDPNTPTSTAPTEVSHSGRGVTTEESNASIPNNASNSSAQRTRDAGAGTLGTPEAREDAAHQSVHDEGEQAQGARGFNVSDSRQVSAPHADASEPSQSHEDNVSPEDRRGSLTEPENAQNNRSQVDDRSSMRSDVSDQRTNAQDTVKTPITDTVSAPAHLMPEGDTRVEDERDSRTGHTPAATATMTQKGKETNNINAPQPATRQVEESGVQQRGARNATVNDATHNATPNTSMRTTQETSPNPLAQHQPSQAVVRPGQLAAKPVNTERSTDSDRSQPTVATQRMQTARPIAQAFHAGVNHSSSTSSVNDQSAPPERVFTRQRAVASTNKVTGQRIAAEPSTVQASRSGITPSAAMHGTPRNASTTGRATAPTAAVRQEVRSTVSARPLEGQQQQSNKAITESRVANTKQDVKSATGTSSTTRQSVAAQRSSSTVGRVMGQIPHGISRGVEERREEQPVLANRNVKTDVQASVREITPQVQSNMRTAAKEAVSAHSASSQLRSTPIESSHASPSATTSQTSSVKRDSTPVGHTMGTRNGAASVRDTKTEQMQLVAVTRTDTNERNAPVSARTVQTQENRGRLDQQPMHSSTRRTESVDSSLGEKTVSTTSATRQNESARRNSAPVGEVMKGRERVSTAPNQRSAVLPTEAALSTVSRQHSMRSESSPVGAMMGRAHVQEHSAGHVENQMEPQAVPVNTVQRSPRPLSVRSDTTAHSQESRVEDESRAHESVSPVRKENSAKPLTSVRDVEQSVLPTTPQGSNRGVSTHGDATRVGASKPIERGTQSAQESEVSRSAPIQPMARTNGVLPQARTVGVSAHSEHTAPTVEGRVTEEQSASLRGVGRRHVEAESEQVLGRTGAGQDGAPASRRGRTVGGVMGQQVHPAGESTGVHREAVPVPARSGVSRESRSPDSQRVELTDRVSPLPQARNPSIHDGGGAGASGAGRDAHGGSARDGQDRTMELTLRKMQGRGRDGQRAAEVLTAMGEREKALVQEQREVSNNPALSKEVKELALEKIKGELHAIEQVKEEVELNLGLAARRVEATVSATSKTGRKADEKEAALLAESLTRIGKAAENQLSAYGLHLNKEGKLESTRLTKRKQTERQGALEEKYAADVSKTLLQRVIANDQGALPRTQMAHNVAKHMATGDEAAAKRFILSRLGNESDALHQELRAANTEATRHMAEVLGTDAAGAHHAEREKILNELADHLIHNLKMEVFSPTAYRDPTTGDRDPDAISNREANFRYQENIRAVERAMKTQIDAESSASKAVGEWMESHSGGHSFFSRNRGEEHRLHALKPRDAGRLLAKEMRQGMESMASQSVLWDKESLKDYGGKTAARVEREQRHQIEMLNFARVRESTEDHASETVESFLKDHEKRMLAAPDDAAREDVLQESLGKLHPDSHESGLAQLHSERDELINRLNEIDPINPAAGHRSELVEAREALRSAVTERDRIANEDSPGDYSRIAQEKRVRDALVESRQRHLANLESEHTQLLAKLAEIGVEGHPNEPELRAAGLPNTGRLSLIRQRQRMNHEIEYALRATDHESGARVSRDDGGEFNGRILSEEIKRQIDDYKNDRRTVTDIGNTPEAQALAQRFVMPNGQIMRTRGNVAVERDAKVQADRAEQRVRAERARLERQPDANVAAIRAETELRVIEARIAAEDNATEARAVRLANQANAKNTLANAKVHLNNVRQVYAQGFFKDPSRAPSKSEREKMAVRLKEGMREARIVQQDREAVTRAFAEAGGNRQQFNRIRELEHAKLAEERIKNELSELREAKIEAERVKDDGERDITVTRLKVNADTHGVTRDSVGLSRENNRQNVHDRIDEEQLRLAEKQREIAAAEAHLKALDKTLEEARGGNMKDEYSSHLGWSDAIGLLPPTMMIGVPLLLGHVIKKGVRSYAHKNPTTRDSMEERQRNLQDEGSFWRQKFAADPSLPIRRTAEQHLVTAAKEFQKAKTDQRALDEILKKNELDFHFRDEQGQDRLEVLEKEASKDGKTHGSAVEHLREPVDQFRGLSNEFHKELASQLADDGQTTPELRRKATLFHEKARLASESTARNIDVLEGKLADARRSREEAERDLPADNQRTYSIKEARLRSQRAREIKKEEALLKDLEILHSQRDNYQHLLEFSEEMQANNFNASVHEAKRFGEYLEKEGANLESKLDIKEARIEAYRAIEQARREELTSLVRWGRNNQSAKRRDIERVEDAKRAREQLAETLLKSAEERIEETDRSIDLMAASRMHDGNGDTIDRQRQIAEAYRNPEGDHAARYYERISDVLRKEADEGEEAHHRNLADIYNDPRGSNRALSEHYAALAKAYEGLPDERKQFEYNELSDLAREPFDPAVAARCRDFASAYGRPPDLAQAARHQDLAHRAIDPELSEYHRNMVEAHGGTPELLQRHDNLSHLNDQVNALRAAEENARHLVDITRGEMRPIEAEIAHIQRLREELPPASVNAAPLDARRQALEAQLRPIHETYLDHQRDMQAAAGDLQRVQVQERQLRQEINELMQGVDHRERQKLAMRFREAESVARIADPRERDDMAERMTQLAMAHGNVRSGDGTATDRALEARRAHEISKAYDIPLTPDELAKIPRAEHANAIAQRREQLADFEDGLSAAHSENQNIDAANHFSELAKAHRTDAQDRQIERQGEVAGKATREADQAQQRIDDLNDSIRGAEDRIREQQQWQQHEGRLMGDVRRAERRLSANEQAVNDAREARATLRRWNREEQQRQEQYDNDRHALQQAEEIRDQAQNELGRLRQRLISMSSYTPAAGELQQHINRQQGRVDEAEREVSIREFTANRSNAALVRFQDRQERREDEINRLQEQARSLEFRTDEVRRARAQLDTTRQILRRAQAEHAGVVDETEIVEGNLSHAQEHALRAVYSPVDARANIRLYESRIRRFQREREEQQDILNRAQGQTGYRREIAAALRSEDAGGAEHYARLAEVYRMPADPVSAESHREASVRFSDEANVATNPEERARLTKLAKREMDLARAYGREDGSVASSAGSISSGGSSHNSDRTADVDRLGRGADHPSSYAVAALSQARKKNNKRRAQAKFYDELATRLSDEGDDVASATQFSEKIDKNLKDVGTLLTLLNKGVHVDAVKLHQKAVSTNPNPENAEAGILDKTAHVAGRGIHHIATKLRLKSEHKHPEGFKDGKKIFNPSGRELQLISISGRSAFDVDAKGREQRLIRPTRRSGDSAVLDTNLGLRDIVQNGHADRRARELGADQFGRDLGEMLVDIAVDKPTVVGKHAEKANVIIAESAYSSRADKVAEEAMKAVLVFDDRRDIFAGHSGADTRKAVKNAAYLAALGALERGELPSAVAAAALRGAITRTGGRARQHEEAWEKIFDEQHLAERSSRFRERFGNSDVPNRKVFRAMDREANLAGDLNPGGSDVGAAHRDRIDSHGLKATLLRNRVSSDARQAKAAQKMLDAAIGFSETSKLVASDAKYGRSGHRRRVAALEASEAVRAETQRRFEAGEPKLKDHEIAKIAMETAIHEVEETNVRKGLDGLMGREHERTSARTSIGMKSQEKRLDIAKETLGALTHAIENPGMRAAIEREKELFRKTDHAKTEHLSSHYKSEVEKLANHLNNARAGAIVPSLAAFEDDRGAIKIDLIRELKIDGKAYGEADRQRVDEVLDETAEKLLEANLKDFIVKECVAMRSERGGGDHKPLSERVEPTLDTVLSDHVYRKYLKGYGHSDADGHAARMDYPFELRIHEVMTGAVEGKYKTRREALEYLRDNPDGTTTHEKAETRLAFEDEVNRLMKGSLNEKPKSIHEALTHLADPANAADATMRSKAADLLRQVEAFDKPHMERLAVARVDENRPEYYSEFAKNLSKDIKSSDGIATLRAALKTKAMPEVAEDVVTREARRMLAMETARQELATATRAVDRAHITGADEAQLDRLNSEREAARRKYDAAMDSHVRETAEMALRRVDEDARPFGSVNKEFLRKAIEADIREAYHADITRLPTGREVADTAIESALNIRGTNVLFNARDQKAVEAVASGFYGTAKQLTPAKSLWRVGGRLVKNTARRDIAIEAGEAARATVVAGAAPRGTRGLSNTERRDAHLESVRRNAFSRAIRASDGHFHTYGMKKPAKEATRLYELREGTRAQYKQLNDIARQAAFTATPGGRYRIKFGKYRIGLNIEGNGLLLRGRRERRKEAYDAARTAARQALDDSASPREIIEAARSAAAERAERVHSERQLRQAEASLAKAQRKARDKADALDERENDAAAASAGEHVARLELARRETENEDAHHPDRIGTGQYSHKRPPAFVTDAIRAEIRAREAFNNARQTLDERQQIIDEGARGVRHHRALHSAQRRFDRAELELRARSGERARSQRTYARNIDAANDAAQALIDARKTLAGITKGISKAEKARDKAQTARDKADNTVREREDAQQHATDTRDSVRDASGSARDAAGNPVNKKDYKVIHDNAGVFRTAAQRAARARRSTQAEHGIVMGDARNRRHAAVASGFEKTAKVAVPFKIRELGSFGKTRKLRHIAAQEAYVAARREMNGRKENIHGEVVPDRATRAVTAGRSMEERIDDTLLAGIVGAKRGANVAARRSTVNHATARLVGSSWKHAEKATDNTAFKRNREIVVRQVMAEHLKSHSGYMQWLEAERKRELGDAVEKMLDNAWHDHDGDGYWYIENNDANRAKLVKDLNGKTNRQEVERVLRAAIVREREHAGADEGDRNVDVGFDPQTGRPINPIVQKWVSERAGEIIRANQRLGKKFDFAKEQESKVFDRIEELVIEKGRLYGTGKTWLFSSFRSNTQKRKLNQMVDNLAGDFRRDDDGKIIGKRSGGDLQKRSEDVGLDVIAKEAKREIEIREAHKDLWEKRRAKDRAEADLAAIDPAADRTVAEQALARAERAVAASLRRYDDVIDEVIVATARSAAREASAPHKRNRWVLGVEGERYNSVQRKIPAAMRSLREIYHGDTQALPTPEALAEAAVIAVSNWKPHVALQKLGEDRLDSVIASAGGFTGTAAKLTPKKRNGWKRARNEIAQQVAEDTRQAARREVLSGTNEDARLAAVTRVAFNSGMTELRQKRHWWGAKARYGMRKPIKEAKRFHDTHADGGTRYAQINKVARQAAFEATPGGRYGLFNIERKGLLMFGRRERRREAYHAAFNAAQAALADSRSPGDVIVAARRAAADRAEQVHSERQLRKSGERVTKFRARAAAKQRALTQLTEGVHGVREARALERVAEADFLREDTANQQAHHRDLIGTGQYSHKRPPNFVQQAQRQLRDAQRDHANALRALERGQQLLERGQQLGGLGGRRAVAIARRRLDRADNLLADRETALRDAQNRYRDNIDAANRAMDSRNDAKREYKEAQRQTRRAVKKENRATAAERKAEALAQRMERQRDQATNVRQWMRDTENSNVRDIEGSPSEREAYQVVKYGSGYAMPFIGKTAAQRAAKARERAYRIGAVNGIVMGDKRDRQAAATASGFKRVAKLSVPTRGLASWGKVNKRRDIAAQEAYIRAVQEVTGETRDAAGRVVRPAIPPRKTEQDVLYAAMMAAEGRADVQVDRGADVVEGGADRHFAKAIDNQHAAEENIHLIERLQSHFRANEMHIPGDLADGLLHHIHDQNGVLRELYTNDPAFQRWCAEVFAEHDAHNLEQVGDPELFRAAAGAMMREMGHQLDSLFTPDVVANQNASQSVRYSAGRYIRGELQRMAGDSPEEMLGHIRTLTEADPRHPENLSLLQQHMLANDALYNELRANNAYVRYLEQDPLIVQRTQRLIARAQAAADPDPVSQRQARDGAREHALRNAIRDELEFFCEEINAHLQSEESTNRLETAVTDALRPISNERDSYRMSEGIYLDNDMHQDRGMANLFAPLLREQKQIQAQAKRDAEKWQDTMRRVTSFDRENTVSQPLRGVREFIEDPSGLVANQRDVAETQIAFGGTLPARTSIDNVERQRTHLHDQVGRLNDFRDGLEEDRPDAFGVTHVDADFVATTRDAVNEHESDLAHLRSQHPVWFEHLFFNAGDQLPVNHPAVKAAITRQVLEAATVENYPALAGARTHDEAAFAGAMYDSFMRGLNQYIQANPAFLGATTLAQHEAAFHSMLRSSETEHSFMFEFMRNDPRLAQELSELSTVRRELWDENPMIYNPRDESSRPLHDIMNEVGDNTYHDALDRGMPDADAMAMARQARAELFDNILLNGLVRSSLNENHAQEVFDDIFPRIQQAINTQFEEATRGALPPEANTQRIADALLAQTYALGGGAHDDSDAGSSAGGGGVRAGYVRMSAPDYAVPFHGVDPTFNPALNAATDAAQRRFDAMPTPADVARQSQIDERNYQQTLDDRVGGWTRIFNQLPTLEELRNMRGSSYDSRKAFEEKIEKYSFGMITQGKAMAIPQGISQIFLASAGGAEWRNTKPQNAMASMGGGVQQYVYYPTGN